MTVEPAWNRFVFRWSISLNRKFNLFSNRKITRKRSLGSIKHHHDPTKRNYQTLSLFLLISAINFNDFKMFYDTQRNLHEKILKLCLSNCDEFIHLQLISNVFNPIWFDDLHIHFLSFNSGKIFYLFFSLFCNSNLIKIHFSSRFNALKVKNSLISVEKCSRATQLHVRFHQRSPFYWLRCSTST